MYPKKSSRFKRCQTIVFPRVFAEKNDSGTDFPSNMGGQILFERRFGAKNWLALPVPNEGMNQPLQLVILGMDETSLIPYG